MKAKVAEAELHHAAKAVREALGALDLIDREKCAVTDRIDTRCQCCDHDAGAVFILRMHLEAASVYLDKLAMELGALKVSRSADVISSG